MCGIAGAYRPEGLPTAVLDIALNAIQHRGPDGAGTYVDGPIAFGMRRLSIIDVEGGQQPIANEDGTVWVVFNGEIYNYVELTRDLEARGHRFHTASDTEVLVHLYEEYGPEMNRYLRGMFAYAIWDNSAHRLYMSRDYFGQKPLYYCRAESNTLLFASELKALCVLATSVGKPLTIREQGIYDYLSLMSIPQPETIYEGVYSLMPGSWLLWDGEQVVIQDYWRPDYRHKVSVSFEEATEQCRKVIAESVRLHLRSDVPLGVLLSGGIDSSIVAYEASRVLGGDLQTFTVSTQVDHFDESTIAVRTARAYGVRNTILPLAVSPLDSLQYLVNQYDQPYADPSAIPSIEIARLARKNVKVVLNGDGGDELFLGYRRYLAAWYGSHLNQLPACLPSIASWVLQQFGPVRRSRLGYSARFLRTLGHTPGKRCLLRTTDALLEVDKHRYYTGGPLRSTEMWLDQIITQQHSELEMQLQMDRLVILPSMLLVKMDIATMAASLEGRSPLLDYKVAEFAASLPVRYHLSRGKGKVLLRAAYRGIIPDEVLNAPKRGFEIPLVKWLQTDLNEITRDTLGSPSALVRKYVTNDYIEGLLSRRILLDHNCGLLLYSLLTLELWLKQSVASASNA